jgi:hypothetical protein
MNVLQTALGILDGRRKSQCDLFWPRTAVDNKYPRL